MNTLFNSKYQMKLLEFNRKYCDRATWKAQRWLIKRKLKEIYVAFQRHKSDMNSLKFLNKKIRQKYSDRWTWITHFSAVFFLLLLFFLLLVNRLSTVSSIFLFLPSMLGTILRDEKCGFAFTTLPCDLKLLPWCRLVSLKKCVKSLTYFARSCGRGV